MAVTRMRVTGRVTEKVTEKVMGKVTERMVGTHWVEIATRWMERGRMRAMRWI